MKFVTLIKKAEVYQLIFKVELTPEEDEKIEEAGLRQCLIQSDQDVFPSYTIDQLLSLQSFESADIFQVRSFENYILNDLCIKVKGLLDTLESFEKQRTRDV